MVPRLSTTVDLAPLLLVGWQVVLPVTDVPYLSSLILLVAVVAALAGSAHYDIGWLLVAVLTLAALIPVIVALLFTLWTATRPTGAELKE